MKDLKFICAQPDDTYFTWQVHLWLESLREIGHSDKAIVLIFVPSNRVQNQKWKQVIDLYPEAEFAFYKDENNLNQYISMYIPILRPYVLWKHFKLNPQLQESAIFYCDCDILFTKNFDVNSMIDDDVCYLSDTNSYISAEYFDSKVKDVLLEKLEDYKTKDVLGEVCSLIGISREIAVANNANSGGAQYLLKNINADFWNKVMDDSILIKTYLGKINREYFENESKGFQSWCADMWAVLWNLWLRDQKVLTPKELNFSWATDSITSLDKRMIFHNAGLTSDRQDNYPCFYKGKYHQGADPTKDSYLQTILNDEESKKHCTWYYANKLQELSEKYKLNY